MILTHRLRFLFVLLFAFSVAACDSSSGDEGEVVATDIELGTGSTIQPGQTLIVEYVGRFTDGSIFDSTDEKGEPFTFAFGVNRVIKGWDIGLEGMKVGGKRRLEIPSHLAFGKNGQCFSNGECAVPGNTDVVYEVTLLDIFDEVILKDTVLGDGDTADFGDVLVVSYIGQFTNSEGEVFDASNIQGGHYLFTLGAGSVIQGWDLGLLGMKVGGTRELTIPPLYGYGAYGVPGKIPPYAVLFFTVELIELVKRPTG
jgi:peptidylprolyl isomerase